jgi:hypothetical protein
MVAETEQALSPVGLIERETLGNLFERYRGEISPSKKGHHTEHNRLNKCLRGQLVLSQAINGYGLSGNIQP